jgi:outer membrane protein assembly factor BamB
VVRPRESSKPRHVSPGFQCYIVVNNHRRNVARSLYVSFGSFGIYCYDLAGNPQWQRDLGRMNTRLAWGEAVTPVIHENRLLLNWDQEKDSALICLDAGTGKTLWRTPRDEATSWNTPLVVEHQGHTQVVVNGTKRARGYDLETGKELWQCGPMTVNAIPSPVAADGIVYCMAAYQGSAAVAVPLESRGDVGEAKQWTWRINKGTPYVPSPLLLGDRLIFTQGNNALLTILDRKNGQALLDREHLPDQQSFYASPVAAAGRIYLVDREGTTLVKDALAWKAEHKCVSCHHAALVTWAMREAKQHGHAVTSRCWPS